MFKATFNNISVKSWQSVLLVEDLNWEYWEKTIDLPQVRQLDHILLYRVHLATSGIQSNNLSCDSH